MLTTIERARRYVQKCNPAISGQGGHNATFHVAAVLGHRFALNDADALALLREWNAVACQPPWSERELQHKVASVHTAKHHFPRGDLLGAGERPAPAQQRAVSLAPAKIAPQMDPVTATENFLHGFRCTEEQLCAASPVSLMGDSCFDGAALVQALYAPGELINFVTEYTEETGRDGKLKTRPAGYGRTLERNLLVARFEQGGSDTGKAGGWLRMNPLDGKGVNDENVVAFRFALLECDNLPLEMQLALFAKLPLPIAAVLSSGGRSMHAWVKVDAPDEHDYRVKVARLIEILKRFGVDGQNKNPSRLSRLPGAKRIIGAVGDGCQRLLYLNPKPEEGSIL